MSEISPELQRSTQALADAMSDALAAMDSDHMAHSRPAGQFTLDGRTARLVGEGLRIWSAVSKMDDSCENWEDPKAAAAQAIFDAADNAFSEVCPADFDRDDDAEVPVRLSLRAQEGALDALEEWAALNPAKAKRPRA